MSEHVAAERQGTDRLGREDLVVCKSIDSASLRRLLESLVREDCVHSWRNFGPEGTLEELLRWENERRPTELFFFQLKHGGGTQVVAAGAVADRINHDFSFPGFCVLGRCCILPEFRGRGFYRQVLRFRLEHCRSKFGDALNAIHIGAVNERISRVITNHRFPGISRFIHLGEEELRVAGEIRTVGAYLLLMPGYVRRVQASLAGADAPPCVVELRSLLSRIDVTAVRNLGMLVKETFEEARELGWFERHDSRVIEMLLGFCRSIPLVGFR